MIHTSLFPQQLKYLAFTRLLTLSYLSKLLKELHAQKSTVSIRHHFKEYVALSWILYYPQQHVRVRSRSFFPLKDSTIFSYSSFEVMLHLPLHHLHHLEAFAMRTLRSHLANPGNHLHLRIGLRNHMAYDHELPFTVIGFSAACFIWLGLILGQLEGRVWSGLWCWKN